eukprot:TRINITY_DN3275_c0_g1_i1.p1 TRINITY_DN3275_c0_g1~~TRINITY_DN3275_c0_g1_i1.p1  ORF type:complete len:433 (-),score=56.77 TRINITY_DN3275_c0_g1_i1:262-1560(-)
MMAAALTLGLIACAPAARIQVGTRTNQCTEEDLQKMNEAGPGSSQGSFPHVSRDCGMATWSAWHPLSFNKTRYIDCAQERIGLTTSCASCFADYSSYGFRNCWNKCYYNWCSSKCLTCVQKGMPDLESCVGATPPAPEVCDGPGKSISTTKMSEDSGSSSVSTTKVAEDSGSSSVETPAGSSGAGADKTPTVDTTTTLAGHFSPTTATTTVVEFTGACSAADKAIMDKAGPGHQEGTWAKICSDCGRSSFSVIRMRVDESAYVQCLKRKVPLSENCAGCFAGSAKYGAAACWSSCMGSWCSKGCLKCVSDGYMANLSSCVGFSPPLAWACDGSGYRPSLPSTSTPPPSKDVIDEPPPIKDVIDDDSRDRTSTSDGSHSDANSSAHKEVNPNSEGKDSVTVNLITVSGPMVVVYSVTLAVLAASCGFCLAKRC